MRSSAPTPGHLAQRSFVDVLATLVMVLCLPAAAVFMTISASASGGGSLADKLDTADSSTDTQAAAQWAGYEWRGRPPIDVTLAANVSNDAYRTAIAHAASAWSLSDVVDLSIGSSGKRRIVVYEGEYGTDKPAAWTQVSKRNGYVSSATVYLNDTKLAGATPWMLDFAVCHEVGHGLGLDHQMNAVEPSCLSPMLPGSAPNAEDYRQLDVIYGGIR